MKNYSDVTKFELANRLFFRLYLCANMLHKTGSRAVEPVGLTTQQWAVLGALSQAQATAGISVGDLARYLRVSRQNLSGIIARMADDGHLTVAPDGRDRRSRLITITGPGRQLWQARALPRISAYYNRLTDDFSITDMGHMLHYVSKLLNKMEDLDLEYEKGR